MATLTLGTKLRTCLVKQRGCARTKALFHCWFTEYYYRNATQRSDLWAIVEYEDGSIHKIDSRYIIFLDSHNEFEQYCWPEEKDDVHI